MVHKVVSTGDMVLPRQFWHMPKLSKPTEGTAAFCSRQAPLCLDRRTTLGISVLMNAQVINGGSSSRVYHCKEKWARLTVGTRLSLKSARGHKKVGYHRE